MNRRYFQKLATERLADAQALFVADRFAAAYYLAGYSVEYARKAIIAKHTAAEDFPPKDSQKYWVHNLESLIVSAGLKSQLTQEIEAAPQFAESWTIVKEWSEQYGYDLETNRLAAEGLIEAITRSEGGILSWLIQCW